MRYDYSLFRRNHLTMHFPQPRDPRCQPWLALLYLRSCVNERRDIEKSRSESFQITEERNEFRVETTQKFMDPIQFTSAAAYAWGCLWIKAVRKTHLASIETLRDYSTFNSVNHNNFVAKLHFSTFRSISHRPQWQYRRRRLFPLIEVIARPVRTHEAHLARAATGKSYIGFRNPNLQHKDPPITNKSSTQFDLDVATFFYQVVIQSGLSVPAASQ